MIIGEAVTLNIDSNLIFIKGEDKTASVTSWRFDRYKPVVFITFNGQKEYPYNTACVEFLKNPKKFTGRPKIPSYLKEGKLNVVTIDSSRLRKTGCKERTGSSTKIVLFSDSSSIH